MCDTWTRCPPSIGGNYLSVALVLTFYTRVIITHFSFEKESYYKMGSKHYKKAIKQLLCWDGTFLSLHSEKGLIGIL